MMEPKQIRAELILHDKKLIDIASELKLSQPNISAVIAGRRPNPRVRAAIAKAINRSVEEIWPETMERKAKK